MENYYSKPFHELQGLDQIRLGKVDTGLGIGVEAFDNHPFGLGDFVLGEGQLMQSKALLEAIEGMRLRKPNSAKSLMDALNSSLRQVPKFKVEGQEVVPVRIGSVHLQMSLVLELKGRNTFRWESLKRCAECNDYFYGGGSRKAYCKAECERRNNNRYKPERDRFRSARYQFNIREKKRGKKKTSSRVFREKIYKPRQAQDKQ